MSVVEEFTHRAEQLHEAAQKRNDEVYGVKAWYSSINLIENGARVAFIGANPGGGQQEWKDDVESGGLQAPYDGNRQYNAWLDDEHWGASRNRQLGLQGRVREAFRILYGEQSETVLRHAACFNVVPSRSPDVQKLSQETWMAGAFWCLDVTEHVSPETIICLGNGDGRSAWSIFASRWMGAGVKDVRQREVYNNFSVKVCRISQGALEGALVVGLPHLSRVNKMDAVREAAESLEICPIT